MLLGVNDRTNWARRRSNGWKNRICLDLCWFWVQFHTGVFNLWHHVLSANLRSIEYRSILAIQKFYFLKRHSSGFFFVSASLLRQLMLAALFFVIQGLCFLSHLGGDTIASGSRYERVWEEIRTRLGRDTVASGTAFANKYRNWFIGDVAPCFIRCCHVASTM